MMNPAPGVKEFTTFLFNKDDYIGEVRVRGRADDQTIPHKFSGKVMRISDFSPWSERCQPLLVMHSIASQGAWFTMDAIQQDTDGGLNLLYSSCLHEAKTAVVQMESGMELHLIAMSRAEEDQKQPCFWGFTAAEGVYASCLTMLNLRCLALVFDLDETLLVANTMRSFEDRIEAVARKIRVEVDRERIPALAAEMKRYQEDKAILTQYMESDQFVDSSGKVFKAQIEMVPSSSDVTPALERPVLRLLDRNVILTRINPASRWTSVLVRLRPAWEDFRNYLIAKGRKRFEVFICTMSEKDYALEMWRLLDPDASLIPSLQLQERLFCVKAGYKSLTNVFHKGKCHPRMSMVIDDRLDVWEELDQPRVHVVPAFAPYFAPQAETSGTLPVLSIAKNIASKVRGGFFKDFDENLSQQLGSARFETDASTLPEPLDVSSYLLTEKSAQPVITVADGSLKDLPDGISDAETETAVNPQAQLRLEDANTSIQPVEAADGKLGDAGENWEEGEVPESELDPDTRRRLLILKHGQDTEQTRAAGEWDEDESPGGPGSSGAESPSRRYDGMYGNQSVLSMGLMRTQRQDRKLLDYSDTEYKINGNVQQPDPILLLQAMAQKYKAQVEFRSSVSPTIELQFCAEVLYNGEKIARGFGRTSKDARIRASEDALRLLSSEFRDTTFLLFLPEKQDLVTPAPQAPQWNSREAPSTPKLPSFNAVAALKDLCAVENLSVTFRNLQLDSNTMVHNCEVEVAGRVMGRGRGLSWEIAKQEASEEALRGMKSNNNGKRNGPPPRSPPPANKRRSGGRGQGRGNRVSPRKQPSQMAVRLK